MLCVWTNGRDVSLQPPRLWVRQYQSTKEVCRREQVCIAHPCYCTFGQLRSSVSQSKLSRRRNCHFFRGSNALAQWKAIRHGVIRLSPSTHIKKQSLLSTLKQFRAPVLENRLISYTKYDSRCSTAKRPPAVLNSYTFEYKIHLGGKENIPLIIKCQAPKTTWNKRIHLGNISFPLSLRGNGLSAELEQFHNHWAHSHTQS